MATVDNLQIQISANASDAIKQLNALSRSLTKFQNSVQMGLGNSTGKAVKNVNALALSFSYANNSTKTFNRSITNLRSGLGQTLKRFVNITAATAAFTKSIKSSMDYVENLNYFNAAFRQVADKAVTDWASLGYDSAESYYKSFSERAQELTAKMTGFQLSDSGRALATGSKSLGIDPTLLMGYQAQFAQMSSSMGIASETALKLSNVLTEIGADLASVKNMDFKKVWEDMSSGLAGMSRTLDKYGVNIRNVNLQQRLNELGIEANITALNQNEKALLRSIILLDSTRYAWGDLSNTLYQPANQFRILQSSISNLARTIGNLFLPIIAKVLPYLNAFVKSLQSIAEWIGTLIGIEKFDWGGLSSGSGTASDALSDIYDEADNTASALDKVASSSKKAQSGLRSFDKLKVISMSKTSNAGNTSGVGLDTTKSGLLQSALDKMMSEYQSAWDDAYNKLEERNNQFAENVKKAFESNGVYGVGEYIGKTLTDGLNSINWDDIKQKAVTFSTGLAQFMNGLISPELFGSMGSTLAETLNTIVQSSLAFGETFDFENLGKSIAQGFNDFVDTFEWGDLADDIDAWVQGAYTTIKTALLGDENGEGGIKWSSVWDGVKDFISHIDIETIEIIIGGLSLKYGTEILTGSLLKGEIKKKLVTALTSVGGLSGLFTTDLGVIFGAGTATEIGLTIGAGIIAGIGAAIGGFNFGKWLGEKLFPDDADYYKNFSWFGEGGFFDTIKNTDFTTLADAWTDLTNDIQDNDIYRILTGTFVIPKHSTIEEFGDKLKELPTWFEDAKASISDKWTQFSTWWSDNIGTWWDNSVSPWFTAEKWSELGENIKKSLSDKWDSFTQWWTDTGIPAWWDDNVSPWFTKEKWLSLGDNIKTGISDKWKSFTTWWSDTGFAKWWTDVKDHFSKEKWTWSGIKDGLSAAWENAISAIKNLWNGFANWLNDKLNFSWDGIPGFTEGGSINLGKIPTFETGGYVPSRYTMIMAGENGVPEIAGTVGGKTAVAGGVEITGIKDAINSTAQQEIALLKQNNQLLQGILEKEFGITTDQIGIAARQYGQEQFNQKHKNVYVF